MAILPGDTEHVGQDEQRHLGRYLFHEVDLALVGHGVDDGFGVPLDRPHQLAHRPGGEHPADDAPQVGVLGGIHVQHHLAQQGNLLGTGVAQEGRPQPPLEVLLLLLPHAAAMRTATIASAAKRRMSLPFRVRRP